MQGVKQWVKKNFGRWIYRARLSPARIASMEQWLQQWKDQPAGKLSDTSFDIFTYHGEDGMIRYLLNRLPAVPPLFADIGSGDCIKSNCATLALHYGWKGVFIDHDKKQLAVGRAFYRNQIREGQVTMIQADVQVATVNQLIRQSGLNGPVGLLSVDIDGNDYWIWKAVEHLQPAIVVIEAKVEFGRRSIVVPYGPLNHHSANPMYNGASVGALCKLGASKGYKLAGANKQGYNLFFVKEDAPVPGIPAAEIFSDPEISAAVYPDAFFEKHQFETV